MEPADFAKPIACGLSDSPTLQGPSPTQRFGRFPFLPRTSHFWEGAWKINISGIFSGGRGILVKKRASFLACLPQKNPEIRAASEGSEAGEMRAEACPNPKLSGSHSGVLPYLLCLAGFKGNLSLPDICLNCSRGLKQMEVLGGCSTQSSILVPHQYCVSLTVVVSLAVGCAL